MKILTIIIPTFNRTQPLLNNLNLLNTIFEEVGCKTAVEIIISDDCSKAEHIDAIENYIENSNLMITLHTHKVNLGIQENELFLIEQVKTEFTMLLGEDDYLNLPLFSEILEYIRTDKHISVIIPNFYTVDEQRKRTSRCRDAEREDRVFEIGHLQLMFKAHQMSGLVFRVSGLVDSYRSRVSSNVYPQLYFVGFNILRGKSIHITKNPLENTVLKKKQFDYSLDNLTGDILKNVDALEIPLDNRVEISKFFLTKNYLRYSNPYTWIHPKKLFVKVNGTYDFDRRIIRCLKWNFFFSYFKIPSLAIKYCFIKIKGN